MPHTFFRVPLLVLKSLLVFFLACQAAFNAEALIYKTTTVSLDNGLQLIVHSDSKAPIISLVLCYHVGSAQEGPAQHGMAHLFEHLMFHGTSSAPAGFLKDLENVGGVDVNARTGSDRTCFFEAVPTNALEYTLSLEADRMQHLQITSDTLEAEKRIVINEINSGANRPYALVNQLIVSNAFSVGHPYQHSVLGTDKEVQAIQLAEARAWYQHYYTPVNATLVLVGDLQAETARSLVKKFFAAIPPGDQVNHDDLWPEFRVGDKSLTVNDEVPTSRLVLEWNIPPAETNDEEYVRILTWIYARNGAGRLAKRLSTHAELANNVTYSLDEGQLGGVLSVFIDVSDPSEKQEVRDIALDELHRLLLWGPTDRELKDAKLAMREEFADRLDSSQEAASMIAESMLYTGNPEAFLKLQDEAQAVTTTQVVAACRAPMGGGVLSILVEPHRDLKAVGSAAVLVAPPQSHPSLIGLSPHEEHLRLPNGLSVILVRRRDQTNMRLGLVLRHGFLEDPSGKEGLDYMVATSLNATAMRPKSGRALPTLVSLGAILTTNVRPDNTLLNVSLQKDALKAVLGILTDLIQRPLISPEEFDGYQRGQINKLRSDALTLPNALLRDAPTLLFEKGDSYSTAWTGLGSEGAVASLKRDDLIAAYHSLLEPAQATLIVVGDVETGLLKQVLVSTLGKLRSTNRLPLKEGGQLSRNRSAIYTVERHDAKETMIGVAGVLPGMSDSRIPALTIWNEILGGYFDSRLNTELRQRRGWSYGARSMITLGPEHSLLSVMVSVQPDKLAESMIAIREIMEDLLKKDPQLDRDVSSTVARKERSLPGVLETTTNLRDSLEQELMFGKGEGYLLRDAAEMQAMDADTIRTAATESIQLNRLQWLIIGEIRGREGELKATGLGDVLPFESFQLGRSADIHQ